MPYNLSQASLTASIDGTNRSLDFGNMTLVAGAGSSGEDWDPWRGWSLISFASLTSLLASTGIVVGGVVPYVPQYISIRRSKNSAGFSTYVCLALIAANALRIIFW